MQSSNEVRTIVLEEMFGQMKAGTDWEGKKNLRLHHVIIQCYARRVGVGVKTENTNT